MIRAHFSAGANRRLIKICFNFLPQGRIVIKNQRHRDAKAGKVTVKIMAAIWNFLADNWWLAIIFAPSIIEGIIVFLFPIIDWSGLWKRYRRETFEPRLFWRIFVRLEEMPAWWGRGYLLFSNILSLFWIWGYALYLGGWIILGILRGALWLYRKVLRDYFRYVSDLFKTT